jgi:hypothetical protein
MRGEPCRRRGPVHAGKASTGRAVPPLGEPTAWTTLSTRGRPCRTARDVHAQCSCAMHAGRVVTGVAIAAGGEERCQGTSAAR